MELPLLHAISVLITTTSPPPLTPPTQSQHHTGAQDVLHMIGILQGMGAMVAQNVVGLEECGRQAGHVLVSWVW